MSNSAEGISDMTFELNESNDEAILNRTITLSAANEMESHNKKRSGLTKETGKGQKKADDDEEEEEEEEDENSNEDCESLAMIIEMSQILNTKLSPKSLQYCLRLVKAGVDPVALAQLLHTWRLQKNPQPESLTSSQLTTKEWKT